MERNNAKTNAMDWAIRIGSIIMSGAIMVSSWFLKETIFSLNECKKDIIELKLADERTSNNRFTSNDWVIEKRQLDEQRLVTEKRITVVEESNKMIKELLTEIKDDLKELKTKMYYK